VLNRSPSGTPHAAHAALNIVKLRTTVFPEYDATTEHDGGGGGDLSDRIIDFLASATQENWDLAVEATFDALVKMLNLTLEWDRAIARFTQKSEQMRKVLVKTLDQVSDAQDDAVEAVLANREKLSDDERCG
jgi:hypothetical protein